MRSLPIELTEQQVNALQGLLRRGPGGVIPEIDYVTFKCFHIPCDLFSLGVLWLQTLLETRVQEAGEHVRRGQSIAEIRQEAMILAEDLTLWSRRQNVPEGESLGALVQEECVSRFQKIDEDWRKLPDSKRKTERTPWCLRDNLFYEPNADNWRIAQEIPLELFSRVPRDRDAPADEHRRVQLLPGQRRLRPRRSGQGRSDSSSTTSTGSPRGSTPTSGASSRWRRMSTSRSGSSALRWTRTTTRSSSPKTSDHPRPHGQGARAVDPRGGGDRVGRRRRQADQRRHPLAFRRPREPHAQEGPRPVAARALPLRHDEHQGATDATAA